jgi:hypothetical protein
MCLIYWCLESLIDFYRVSDPDPGVFAGSGILKSLDPDPEF